MCAKLIAVNGLGGCYAAYLVDVVEIYGLPRLGMQLLANIGEHFVVFVVATHDWAGIGWQAVLSGDSGGCAGEVEGNIAMQLEFLVEMPSLHLTD
jgi:hypothetical protein